MNFQFEEDNEINICRKRRKSAKTFSLKLTSLIDMFTILLVFLLKSFSAEGEIMTVTKDLQLPISTSQKPPEVASIIAATNDWILLDGERATTTRTALNKTRSMVIDSLKAALKTKKDVASHVGQFDANMGFSGKICIQADKEIPYQLIKKIMITCGQTGYNDMLLAVMQEE